SGRPRRVVLQIPTSFAAENEAKGDIPLNGIFFAIFYTDKRYMSRKYTDKRYIRSIADGFRVSLQLIVCLRHLRSGRGNIPIERRCGFNLICAQAQNAKAALDWVIMTCVGHSPLLQPYIDRNLHKHTTDGLATDG